MPERTDSYEEILALNPSSRIFFPLAADLATQGCYQRAASVLRHGLRFHPNFLEARFLLVEVLDACGEKKECTAEAQNVSSVLRSYPSLWKILGSMAKTPGEVLLWRIASLLGQEKELDLMEILTRGLALTPDQSAPAMAIPVPLAPPHRAAVPPCKPASLSKISRIVEKQSAPAFRKHTVFSPSHVPFFAENRAQGSPSDSAAEPHKSSPVRPPKNDIRQDSVSEADTFATGLAALHEAENTISETADPPMEESINLRTRSMADVLSDQGDIEGALHIYEDLLKNNPNSELLRYRTAELRRQLASSSRVSLPSHAQNEGASSDNEKSSVAASEHVTESPSATISGKASFPHADEKETSSLNSQLSNEVKTADMRKHLHPHILVTASVPSRSKPSKQTDPPMGMPCPPPETSSPLRHEPLLSPPKAADENESQLSLAHLLEQLAERLEARALR